MITKSKTFWVSNNELKNIKEGVNVVACSPGERVSHKNLVTISWQEEEQRVEITKSMIKEIRAEYLKGKNGDYFFSDYLINKLFNKGE